MKTYELNGITLALPEHLDAPRIEAKLDSGDYEGAEAHAAMVRVKPGWRVLEIGAGLGYVTSICARAAGPQNVVSVEANPGMLEVIEANLARNGLSGVTLLHGAVTAESESEHVAFRAGPAFWGGSVQPSGRAGGRHVVEVPTLNLDTLLQTYRPHAVIMDIEGAEADLFDAPWPDHIRAVIMELHPKKYADTVIAQIVDCMAQSGLTYDPFTSNGRVLGFRRVRAK